MNGRVDGLLGVDLPVESWAVMLRMILRLSDVMMEDERAACLALCLQVQSNLNDAIYAAANRARAN